AAYDRDAVRRMRQHPQSKEKRGIGEEEDGVASGPNGHDRADQKNLAGLKMRLFGQQIIDARRKKHSDERKQVRRRDHTTLVFGRGAMLDQRIQWNGIKPAEKAEQRQVRTHFPDAESVAGHEKPKDRHAYGAERNPPVL